MSSKRQRVEAVLRGEQPDHPPVGFWYHFGPAATTGQGAVDAHVSHLEQYDLDFLKIMNDHPFPRGRVQVVREVADLRKLEPVPVDAEGLAGQLELVRRLRHRLGRDVFTCTTLFNAWGILRYLTEPPVDHHGPPSIFGEDRRDDTITAMLREDRSAVKAALQTISTSLVSFACECLRAGADGIFLSVRDDWVNRPANGPGTYDEMVRPLDLAILDAAKIGTFNWLHVCGRPRAFAEFAKYPVQVLNWADRAAGPSIAYARDRVKPAIAGGVDNLKTLPKGTPEQCAAEVRDALRQAGDRPILIVPGCTYDPNAVPEANLRAVVAEAKAWAVVQTSRRR
jgi:uroporphyrinogen decarboxylase